MTCPWCDGACQETDLAPLLHPDLAWLWNQLADCADRRGDPELASGSVGLKVPSSPEERSAAVGLLGGRPLSAGQIRRIDLARLGGVLARRDPRLTPGVVAAHGARRRLAQRARSRAEQIDAADGLRTSLAAVVGGLPGYLPGEMDPDAVWTRLYRSGWISRLLADDDREKRISVAAGVLARLPRTPARVDRRVLVPGDPHALDDGTVLAGLVLAMAGVAGAGRRTREAWSLLGVDYDNLLGGLLVLGVRPLSWSVPGDAVMTVPPRELQRVRWQTPPEAGAWAFVTENPSVMTAAAELAATGAGPGTDGTVHLICTAGTPSEIETTAISLLRAVGWRVAVRADFDPSGLAHVRALLNTTPDAAPWRMDTAAYNDHCMTASAGALEVAANDTPWDPGLASAMTRRGAPAYEEDQLSELIGDLRSGEPGVCEGEGLGL